MVKYLKFLLIFSVLTIFVPSVFAASGTWTTFLNYTFDSDLQGLEEWCQTGAGCHMTTHGWSSDFGGTYHLQSSSTNQGTVIGNQSQNLSVNTRMLWNYYVQTFTGSSLNVGEGVFGFCNASLSAGLDINDQPQATTSCSTAEHAGLTTYWNKTGVNVTAVSLHNYSLVLTRENQTGYSLLVTDHTANVTAFRQKDGTIFGENWFAVGWRSAGGIISNDLYVDNLAFQTLLTESPEITLNRPEDNERNKTFTVSYAVSDPQNDTLSCRVLVNTSGTYSVNVTNASLTPPTQVVAEVTAADGFYSWLVECDDGTNFVNSSVRTFELDSTPPFSIAASPVSATLDPEVNVSLIFDGTYEDTSGSMFNVSYTWTNGSGVVFAVHNDTTQNISQLSLHAVVNVSSLADGVYTVFWNGSDSHTKNKIRDYRAVPDAVAKKITYFPSEGQEISVRIIQSPYPIKGLGDVKKVDRHSFQFHPAIPAVHRGEMNSYVFELRSKTPIFVYDESAGHLIVWDSRNWITFDVDGVDDEEYSITNFGLIGTDYVAEVSVNTASEDLVFNSIGGLNTGSEVYTMVVSSAAPPSGGGYQASFVSSDLGTIFTDFFGSFGVAVVLLVPLIVVGVIVVFLFQLFKKIQKKVK